MKSDAIAVYGAGGHGRVVADLARACGIGEILPVDDGREDLPGLEAFLARYGSEIPVALGIGDNRMRRRAAERLREAGCRAATLVHPRAVVSPRAELGEGTVVMAGAVVNCDARIGAGVIVNSSAVVEHDCRIGEYAHLSPGVLLAGGVQVGALSHLGIGSCVIQEIVIGEEVVVGAGAAVTKDLEGYVTAAGVPARVIRRRHG
jgi:UDP-N-acetylbacillosamine N-acetyltransferase